MINRNARLIFGLIVLVCAFFTTCNWDNPVMEKWWEEKSDDPYYVPITKTVPHIIYETIIQQETKYIYQEIIQYIPSPPPDPVPPEVLLQYIDIINIEFIIFAGDSTNYNGPPGSPGGTVLTAQEKTSNDAIVASMESALAVNPDYYLILHGHANPVTGTAAEALELAALSLSRANAVAAEFTDPPIAANRITTKGYGGDRNISGFSSTYAGLNRRVEVILFEILTAPAPGGGGG
ncbi:MAG: hypothetical protein FWG35_01550 [Spirochaetaceae bacterium]|nr:hypothetical protein [Spirochaetaceae bacterium]